MFNNLGGVPVYFYPAILIFYSDIRRPFFLGKDSAPEPFPVQGPRGKLMKRLRHVAAAVHAAGHAIARLLLTLLIAAGHDDFRFLKGCNAAQDGLGREGLLIGQLLFFIFHSNIDFISLQEVLIRFFGFFLNFSGINGLSPLRPY
jgi:hypothetical protein